MIETDNNPYFIILFGIILASFFCMNKKKSNKNDFDEENSKSVLMIGIVGAVFSALIGGSQIAFRLISLFFSNYKYILIFCITLFFCSFFLFVLSRFLNVSDAEKKESRNKILFRKKTYNNLGFLFFLFAVLNFSVMLIIEWV